MKPCPPLLFANSIGVNQTSSHIIFFEPGVSFQNCFDRIAGRDHSQNVLDRQPPSTDDRLASENARVHGDSLEKFFLVHHSLESSEQLIGSFWYHIFFSFFQPPSRVGQTFIEIGRFEIRIGRQNSLARFARRQQSHNGPNCNVQAPNARLAAHQRRTMRNSRKLHKTLLPQVS